MNDDVCTWDFVYDEFATVCSGWLIHIYSTAISPSIKTQPLAYQTFAINNIA